MAYSKNEAILRLEKEKELLIKVRKKHLSNLNDLYKQQIDYIQYANDINTDIQDEIESIASSYSDTLFRIDTINAVLEELQ